MFGGMALFPPKRTDFDRRFLQVADWQGLPLNDSGKDGGNSRGTAECIVHSEECIVKERREKWQRNVWQGNEECGHRFGAERGSVNKAMSMRREPLMNTDGHGFYGAPSGHCSAAPC
jgi:hypothetical protein